MPPIISVDEDRDNAAWIQRFVLNEREKHAMGPNDSRFLTDRARHSPLEGQNECEAEAVPATVPNGRTFTAPAKGSVDTSNVVTSSSSSPRDAAGTDRGWSSSVPRPPAKHAHRRGWEALGDGEKWTPDRAQWERFLAIHQASRGGADAGGEAPHSPRLEARPSHRPPLYAPPSARRADLATSAVPPTLPSSAAVALSSPRLLCSVASLSGVTPRGRSSPRLPPLPSTDPSSSSVAASPRVATLTGQTVAPPPLVSFEPLPCAPASLGPNSRTMRHSVEFSSLAPPLGDTVAVVTTNPLVTSPQASEAWTGEVGPLLSARADHPHSLGDVTATQGVCFLSTWPPANFQTRPAAVASTSSSFSGSATAFFVDNGPSSTFPSPNRRAAAAPHPPSPRTLSSDSPPPPPFAAISTASASSTEPLPASTSSHAPPPIHTQPPQQQPPWAPAVPQSPPTKPPLGLPAPPPPCPAPPQHPLEPQAPLIPRRPSSRRGSHVQAAYPPCAAGPCTSSDAQPPIQPSHPPPSAAAAVPSATPYSSLVHRPSQAAPHACPTPAAAAHPHRPRSRSDARAVGKPESPTPSESDCPRSQRRRQRIRAGRRRGSGGAGGTIRPNADEVLKGQLWVGPAQVAIRTPEVLVALGVTHVVNATQFDKSPHTQLFTYLSAAIADDERAAIDSLFPKVNAFIEAAFASAGRVYVHCSAGVSRSVTLVLAYLVAHRSYTLRDAFAHMRACRPTASPNVGFWERLCELEVRIHGGRPSYPPLQYKLHYLHDIVPMFSTAEIADCLHTHAGDIDKVRAALLDRLQASPEWSRRASG